MACLRQLRREFVENLPGSDYALCVRGGGNFSFRLYETLGCGRIPVFVDMDCVLPFMDEIDWKRIGVWLDTSEVDRIGEKVAAFHDSLASG